MFVITHFPIKLPVGSTFSGMGIGDQLDSHDSLDSVDISLVACMRFTCIYNIIKEKFEGTWIEFWKVNITKKCILEKGGNYFFYGHFTVQWMKEESVHQTACICTGIYNFYSRISIIQLIYALKYYNYIIKWIFTYGEHSVFKTGNYCSHRSFVAKLLWFKEYCSCYCILFEGMLFGFESISQ